MIAGEGEKRVSFYVTERMVGNIAVGDRLDIQKDGTGYEAYISEISSMVDSDTGLFKVKAELKHADGIATGSTVKLNLVTEHTENAMMILWMLFTTAEGTGMCTSTRMVLLQWCRWK